MVDPWRVCTTASLSLSWSILQVVCTWWHDCQPPKKNTFMGHLFQIYQSAETDNTKYLMPLPVWVGIKLYLVTWTTLLKQWNSRDDTNNITNWEHTQYRIKSFLSKPIQGMILTTSMHLKNRHYNPKKRSHDKLSKYST